MDRGEIGWEHDSSRAMYKFCGNAGSGDDSSEDGALLGVEGFSEVFLKRSRHSSIRLGIAASFALGGVGSFDDKRLRHSLTSCCVLIASEKGDAGSS